MWPDVRLHTECKEMLRQEQPEIVSVVTPDHLHTDITVDAAEGGVKAILCEKPIATTLADADCMIETAEAMTFCFRWSIRDSGHQFSKRRAN